MRFLALSAVLLSACTPAPYVGMSAAPPQRVVVEGYHLIVQADPRGHGMWAANLDAGAQAVTFGYDPGTRLRVASAAIAQVSGCPVVPGSAALSPPSTAVFAQVRC